MTGINKLRYYIVSETDDGIRLDQFLSKNLEFSREKIKELFGQNPDNSLSSVKDIKKLIGMEIIDNIESSCGEVKNIGFFEIQNLKNNGLLNTKIVKLSQKIKKDECFIVKLKDDGFTQQASTISTSSNVNLAELIIFEDEHLIILNKAPGILSQNKSGNSKEISIGEMMKEYMSSKSEYDEIVGEKDREFIVHRLDRDTSGLMILTKTNKCYQLLVEMFKSKKINKRYLGLVHTKPNPVCGIIREHVARDKINRMKMHVCVPRTLKYYPDAKEAITHYFMRENLSSGKVSLVEFILETGRTHQIRVHLDFIGHPIVGDKLYGTSKNHNFVQEYEIERQMLHSYKLDFIHPITNKELKFEVDIPKDMQHLIDTIKTKV